MAGIILDFDPPQPDLGVFENDTEDLVFFLSWAFSARYGANHEMSVAASVLRGEFKIDLVPLLTFADRNIEEASDAEALELAWQDAAPLAECCRRVAGAFESDNQRLLDLRAEYPRLVGAIRELGRIAEAAALRGARIRVTYNLEDEA
ncbi:MAG TPA: hypothetical protein VFY10_14875 [Dehalococcoidia bacterium]|nr:hypothetical protein [Dehalococcoidia bacterium]